MNIQRIKGLTWVGTLAVGAILAWSVWEFLQHKAELSTKVGREELLAVLDGVEEPPPPTRNLVDYDYVIQTFHTMNWTGKAPPPPVVETPVDEEVEAPVTPIETLLSVLVVQVDTSDPQGSLAYVDFIDPGLDAAAKTHRDRLLRMDDRLGGMHSYAKVSAITVRGVEFTFDDGERQPEVVAPVAFPSEGEDPVIVKVGPDGAIEPARQDLIEVNANPDPYRPDQSIFVGKDTCYIGTDVMDEMKADYSGILSRDIRTRAYRNPSTGQVEGLEITSLRDGSIPANHGISAGEVLKSINGHKVTSKADAINFVKKEADTTTTWVAVFVKQGREITRTYHSPDD